jgi:2-polyprenyl-3-methyl-5-hydroxy-6-metoxy-1,4-benzoquinol methylase
MAANWFEEWFNSPYYHLLYNNRSAEEAEEFIKKISLRLDIRKKAKVLDAACGSGRHSRSLAALGFEVTGIDLSKNNIALAKNFANAHLKFEVFDMRHVFAAKQFDYVFNLFSSFGYAENELDDIQTIKAFAANLKTGGTLVLDYINSESAVKNLKPREIIVRNEIQFQIQKKLENGFIKKQIDFIAKGENHHYEECLKVINLNKFEKMLHDARFEVKQTFGDYELNEFSRGSSPRLILMAKKQ